MGLTYHAPVSSSANALGAPTAAAANRAFTTTRTFHTPRNFLVFMPFSALRKRNMVSLITVANSHLVLHLSYKRGKSL
jgi:hypothetical protein